MRAGYPNRRPGKREAGWTKPMCEPTERIVTVPRVEDVDDESLTVAEIVALAASDGTYVSWDDLKAELHL